MVVSFFVSIATSDYGHIPDGSWLSLDYFHANWGGLCDHIKDIPWECILNLGNSTVASKFCGPVKKCPSVLPLSLEYALVSFHGPLLC